jgi:ABC-type bacteriocin/lantibiotic exporter with double-glycine peptidase domain
MFAMFRSLSFLFKYVWKFNKIYILYAMLYQFASTVPPIVSVVAPKYIIDELTVAKRINVLFLYVFAFIVFNLFFGVLSTYFSRKMTISKAKVFYKFQTFLTSSLADCDFSQLESAEFLDTKEKAQKFLYAHGQGFGLIESAFNIIGKLFVFSGLVAIISTLSVYMVLLFVALVIITSYFESANRKKIAELDLERVPVERKSYYLVTVIEDFMAGKEIRLFKMKNFLVNKMIKHFDSSMYFYIKQTKAKSLTQYFSHSISFLREGLTYLYLIREVISNSISIGSFAMYLSAVSQFSSAMTSVMESILEVNQFKVYFDAFEKFISVTKTLRSGKCEPIMEGPYTICFENVSFMYPGQSKYALRNVSITIAPGEKLSIVGENGSGKTTFAKLLLRLYDPSEGKIYLNGSDIKDIDYDQYQSALSAVFQDFRLFSFTIKENVAFDSECEDDSVISALADAGFDNKLDKLDKGIYSNIHKNFESDGFEPSGGEAQKIAIARASHKNAPIIVLDEPTAALDPKAEYEIYQKFNRITESKTVVYISHRLSSAKFCDNILVLRNGEMAEYGHFEDLINKQGLFSELYQMQSQFYVAQ